MKHYYSLTILTCILILISMFDCKHKKSKNLNKKPFFNAGDVARDFYIQNTVNDLIKNDFHKTNIDTDPSRYTILNGLPAEKDPNMITSEINPNFPEAYYPHYNPALHPFKPTNKKYISRNKLNSIYQKDPDAYYGKMDSYRVIDTSFQGGSKVKIQMGDLTEVYPSRENLEELQRQLDNINRFISLPKELLKSDKGRRVYLKDPNAYYDPTSTDLFKRKAYLESLISNIKKTLAKEKTEEISANDFEYKAVKGKIYVENKFNTEREIENDYIKDSYYYQVKKDIKNHPSNKEVLNRAFHGTNDDVNKVVYKTISRNYEVEHKNIQEKNLENKIKKEKHMRKEENKSEKIKVENKANDKNKKVETIVKPIKIEEKIEIPKTEEIKVEKKVENKSSNNSNTNNETKKHKKTTHKLPDSQGLKIEKVKILTRKHFN